MLNLTAQLYSQIVLVHGEYTVNDNGYLQCYRYHSYVIQSTSKARLVILIVNQYRWLSKFFINAHHFNELYFVANIIYSKDV